MKTTRNANRRLLLAGAILSYACLTTLAEGEYRVLHHFAGGHQDGAGPLCQLIQSGSALYGMTREGGIRNTGTVFCVNTDGSGFKLLHTFMGGTNDGAWPISGSLVLSGSTLYGMTPLGGINGTNGTIFKINADGTGYALLHRFGGLNGREPRGALLLSGSTLYGMTSAGGSHNLGVIFALELAPKLAISLEHTNVQLSWSTNFPDFALESAEPSAGVWTPVPGVTGFSATRPVATSNQFFRLASGATVTDIDGNIYGTVTIGRQVWMVENLKNGLGGTRLARGKLKEAGNTHWHTPNSDATNESGFTALPGGSHWNEVFVDLGLVGHLWSAELQAPGWAWRLALYCEVSDDTIIPTLNSADPRIGWSVRCVRDAPASR